MDSGGLCMSPVRPGTVTSLRSKYLSYLDFLMSKFSAMSTRCRSPCHCSAAAHFLIIAPFVEGHAWLLMLPASSSSREEEEEERDGDRGNRARDRERGIVSVRA